MLHTALECCETPLPSRTAAAEAGGIFADGAARQALGLRHRAMPDDAAQAAHELFAVLRELDDAGVAADLGGSAAPRSRMGRRARPPAARGGGLSRRLAHPLAWSIE